MSAAFTIGQRWMSKTQPELGLGLVIAMKEGRVQIHFPASEETLTYAASNAPLQRVRFEPGDTITDQEGKSFSVKEVTEENGTLLYRGEDRELPESRLSDSISIDKPEARLLSVDLDPIPVCRLRRTALVQRFKSLARPIHGLCGGRISLLPHQLYIANEVSRRQAPRVLLADEVGLGKTIEAGLIIHRLQLTGRASRILLLLPEPLVHQWFVEMLRRFQLSFHLYDEERGFSKEAAEEGKNAFLEDQLIILPVRWLEDHPDRIEEVASAEWDLVVVDEAHHL
ncbi:MAG: SNF2-related protein, partial [Verrucomicrobiota bacterium]